MRPTRRAVLLFGIALTAGLLSAEAQTRRFAVEEATIADIQAAILTGKTTSTEIVNAYLERIKAYNGTCVQQPEGILGKISPIQHAGQINALITLNLRPERRRALGFDDRKARSMTDAVDNNPVMPDALEVAAKQDAYFAANKKLIGPMHGIVFSVKDQYDTFDMRTTSGMDAAYANDRPPDDATFVKRLRDAGAIMLAKANLGELASSNSRSSFGGAYCSPYDTERNPGSSSSGSGSSVGANLVTCSIGEATGGSILHPARKNAVVGIAPTPELVSRDGMIGAGLTTRVGPLCHNVVDSAKVLDVIAGFDSKDEFTAFSKGRIPARPYASFAPPTRLDGIRIGVIREHMNKELFNEVDAETIDLTERALQDLKRLGAVLVDPGPRGNLFQGCIDKYLPQSLNRLFATQFPAIFKTDSSGQPSSDHIAQLLDMFFNPELTPDGPTVRNFGAVSAAGESRYMLNRYLRERGDANIKNVIDLINKSKFYTDIRPDAGFSDRKRALQQIDQEKSFDNVNRIAMRFAVQQVVLQCMATQNLDALVSPAGNVPAYIIGAPTEPEKNGRGISTWGLLGQNGFPSISVPMGFTTHVFDRVRDASAPGGTRLVGPVDAVLPEGIMFVTRPFDEPTLLRISAAYEAATHHRTPPAEFGPLPRR